MALFSFIFSKFRKLKEYQPIALAQKKTFLYSFFDGSSWIECNVNHVLYEPMILQVSFPQKKSLDNFENNKIIIYNFENLRKTNALLQLNFIKKINLDNDSFYFFEVIKSKLHLSPLKYLYLKRLHYLSLKRDKNFIHNYDFSVYKKLVALFSIPKQVWLVSILDKKELHFPIDLCALNKEYITIGVRNSNKSIRKLSDGNIFYLSQTAAEDYEKVYSLGNFIDKNEEKLDTINVDGVLIPNIICVYYKLKLNLKIEFENQTIYISKIVDKKEVNQVKKPLYHIHKIWLWNQSKIQIIEK